MAPPAKLRYKKKEIPCFGFRPCLWSCILHLGTALN